MDSPGALYESDEDSSSSTRPRSLKLGDVWVEPHPYSNVRPYLIPAGPAGTINLSTPGQANLNDLQSDGLPPWYPFETRADFEQTELHIRYGDTDGHINDQLKLARRHNWGSDLTLSNARDMHQILAKVDESRGMQGVEWSNVHFHRLLNFVSFCPQFLHTTVSVPFKKATRDYELYFKHAWPIIRDLLEDPDLGRHLLLYPERRYIRDPRNGGFMRIYHEESSGDDMWKLQVDLTLYSVSLSILVYTLCRILLVQMHL